MNVKDVNLAVENFILRLKRRDVRGSFATAVETLALLRSYISQSRWQSAKSLIASLKSVGARLVAARPTELAVGNMVRRVLHTIREEYNQIRQTGDTTPQSPVPELSMLSRSEVSKPQFALASSMYNLLGDLSVKEIDYSQILFELKPALIQAIGEIMDEIETSKTSIAERALEHIHSNEIILTNGSSKTVEEFLKQAARKRRFQVIVVERAPVYDGQMMALSLSQAGIETTVITDSAVFAIMSRVNKVILGVHIVTANGSLIADSGSRIIAMAAKAHSTPVVVCTGLYKLTPQFSYDQDTFNLCLSPEPAIPFEEGHLIENVDVINPEFDYISAEYVSLFITNNGGITSSYIYRLLSEFYDPEDYDLEEQDPTTPNVDALV